MYTLNIQFNKEDLPLIYQAQQKVVLIQEVTNGLNQVTWSVFSPFESNQATWDNKFYVYASPSPATENNVVEGTSTKAVAPQHSYIFNKELVFSEGTPSTSLSNTEYQIVNSVPSSQFPVLTFGLAQAITVNSISSPVQPLNAAPVLPNQQAVFAPKKSILIFLSSSLKTSTIYNNTNITTLNNLNPIISSGLFFCGSILSRRLFLKTSGIAVLANSIPSISFASESLALRVDFSTNQEITVKYFYNLGKFIQMQSE